MKNSKVRTLKTIQEVDKFCGGKNCEKDLKMSRVIMDYVSICHARKCAKVFDPLKKIMTRT
jgi:hypothetical protein